MLTCRSGKSLERIGANLKYSITWPGLYQVVQANLPRELVGGQYKTEVVAPESSTWSAKGKTCGAWPQNRLGPSLH